ncbi:hypothetical protein [Novosphingobium sp. B 225]|uniref:hypothetical protein n=1 Tax=Novosphingobium sp. B 225 TaxID=1961849 RepID=UPI000B4B07C0|nr:hypothetical protein [Novosphingobium sp. B 225]
MRILSLKKTMLGTALIATALASATPAMANDGRYRRGGDGDTAGAAVVGGIIGLAIGALIASGGKNKHNRCDGDRYDERRCYNQRYEGAQNGGGYYNGYPQQGGYYSNDGGYYAQNGNYNNGGRGYYEGRRRRHEDRGYYGY